MPVTTKDILKKYSKKLESQIQTSSAPSPEDFSKEYVKFRKEMVPEITPYEKWAKSLGNLIKIKIAEKDKIKIQKHLNTAHLDVTASQSLTLAIISLLIISSI